MTDVSQLLSQALGVLFVPILLLSRWLRLKFAADPNKPTLPEWSIYAIMLALTMGLSYGQQSLQPFMQPETVAQIWWVQGLLFFIALLVTDLGADATSTKSVSNAAKIDVANAMSTAPGGKP